MGDPVAPRRRSRPDPPFPAGGDAPSSELGDRTGGRASWATATEVRIGLEAAGGGNLEVFSATIGRQLLERGLIDEVDLHIAPVLLGDGIRLFDNPGGAPVRLEMLTSDASSAAVNVRYHPVATG